MPTLCLALPPAGFTLIGELCKIDCISNVWGCPEVFSSLISTNISQIVLVVFYLTRFISFSCLFVMT